MNENWYIVDDLDQFVLATRKLLFNNFGKSDDQETSAIDDMLNISAEEQSEFDTILTQEESIIIAKNILKKQSNNKTQEVRYLVNDQMYLQMIENLNSRMISNTLNGLVNKGILESGFDTEQNDFVFWIKDSDKNQETPETD